MSNSTSKKEKYAEKFDGKGGGFAGVPHVVMDSTAYVGASDRCKCMMLDLVRQHNGKNNGQLQLAVSWLKKRGWKSVDAIQKAKLELQERGLALMTKKGGLNIGPDRWALTWLAISDYSNLDIKRGTYAPGAWRFSDPPPVMTKRTAPPPNTRKKREASSGVRNSTVPVEGTARPLTVPAYGTKKAVFDGFTVPYAGNNVVASSLPNVAAFLGDGWTFKGWRIPHDAGRKVSVFHARP